LGSRLEQTKNAFFFNVWTVEARFQYKKLIVMNKRSQIRIKFFRKLRIVIASEIKIFTSGLEHLEADFSSRS